MQSNSEAVKTVLHLIDNAVSFLSSSSTSLNKENRPFEAVFFVGGKLGYTNFSTFQTNARTPASGLRSSIFWM
jgi:hypothetical protein